MTLNTLYPAFVQINYISAYAPHTMTIPTVPIELAGSDWVFNLRGAALPVDWDDAVLDFIDVIKPFFVETVTFQNATLFQVDEPGEAGNPVATMDIGVNGSSDPITNTEEKATQIVITWRTDIFGIFKLSFMDAQIISFEKVVSPASAPYTALSAYVTADVTFLAGRDGGRPVTFLQASKGMNKKLRKSYRMN